MIRMQLHCPLGHACYTKRGKTLDVRIGSKPARATSTLGRWGRPKYVMVQHRRPGFVIFAGE